MGDPCKSYCFFQKVCPGISDGKMVGTTDLDFHTVVGDTFYTGLVIICFGTAAILTIWIKVINFRCQLPNDHDIGILNTTKNLDSILLNIFMVSLIILNSILFNTYYKGYFFRPWSWTSSSIPPISILIFTIIQFYFSEFQWKNSLNTLSGAPSILVRYCNQC